MLSWQTCLDNTRIQLSWKFSRGDIVGTCFTMSRGRFSRTMIFQVSPRRLVRNYLRGSLGLLFSENSFGRCFLAWTTISETLLDMFLGKHSRVFFLGGTLWTLSCETILEMSLNVSLWKTISEDSVGKLSWSTISGTLLNNSLGKLAWKVFFESSLG